MQGEALKVLIKMNNISNMWILLVSILVCAVLLTVLLFTANSALNNLVTLDGSADAESKISSSQSKKKHSPRIVAEQSVIRSSEKPNINLLSKKIIQVVNPAGGDISKKAQQAQLRNENSSLDMTQNHDNVHPSQYPQEWDTISNKFKICWIHKKTHKKVCENRI